MNGSPSPDFAYRSLSRQHSFPPAIPSTPPVLPPLPVKASPLYQLENENPLTYYDIRQAILTAAHHCRKDEHPFHVTQLKVDRALKKLLNIEIAPLRQKNFPRYYLHLTHLVGQVSQPMEIWDPNEFLLLRIGSLFRIAVDVYNEVINNCHLPDLPRNDLFERLALEISADIQTYELSKRISELQKKILSLKSDDDSQQEIFTFYEGKFPPKWRPFETQAETILLQFKKFHIPFIMEKINNLLETEEFTFCTGPDSHCVYVNFRLLNGFLWIDLHDAGSWDSPEKESEDDCEETFRPYIIVILNLDERSKWEKKLKDYLYQLFLAKTVSEEKARQLIYKAPFGDSSYLQNTTISWRAFKTQKIGNSLVLSHNLGMHNRLNRFPFDYVEEPYEWVRRKEIELSSQPPVID